MLTLLKPATMVAKRVGTNETNSVFLPFASPPHSMLIYLEIWVQSLGTGVQFVIPNVLSSKSNIVPGGGGYRLHLGGDLLRRSRDDRVQSQPFSTAFQVLLAMIVC